MTLSQHVCLSSHSWIKTWTSSLQWEKTDMCSSCFITRPVGVPQRKTHTTQKAAYMLITLETSDALLTCLSMLLKIVKHWLTALDGIIVRAELNVGSATRQSSVYTILTNTSESCVTNKGATSSTFVRSIIQCGRETMPCVFVKTIERHRQASQSQLRVSRISTMNCSKYIVRMEARQIVKLAYVKFHP